MVKCQKQMPPGKPNVNGVTRELLRNYCAVLVEAAFINERVENS